MNGAFLHYLVAAKTEMSNYIGHWQLHGLLRLLVNR